MMLRNTAREIAVHLAYELSFTALPVEELLETRLNAERFAELAGEDALYQEAPDQLQRDYIARLVTGVSEHAAELDGYIAKYARGWKFSRIPLVASAIMRVAMYEILYMPEIPNSSTASWAASSARSSRMRPGSGRKPPKAEKRAGRGQAAVPLFPCR